MPDDLPKIYERLGKIETSLAKLEQWTVDRPCLAHQGVLNGNGRPGLVERVGTLETEVEGLTGSMRRIGHWVTGFITTAVLGCLGWVGVEVAKIWAKHN